MQDKNLKVDFNKVDFNDAKNVSDIASQLASAKTGKKIKINMKAIAIVLAYLAITGLISNVYFLIKLIF